MKFDREGTGVLFFNVLGDDLISRAQVNVISLMNIFYSIEGDRIATQSSDSGAIAQVALALQTSRMLGRRAVARKNAAMRLQAAAPSLSQLEEAKAPSDQGDSPAAATAASDDSSGSKCETSRQPVVEPASTRSEMEKSRKSKGKGVGKETVVSEPMTVDKGEADKVVRKLNEGDPQDEVAVEAENGLSEHGDSRTKIQLSVEQRESIRQVMLSIKAKKGRGDDGFVGSFGGGQDRAAEESGGDPLDKEPKEKEKERKKAAKKRKAQRLKIVSFLYQFSSVRQLVVNVTAQTSDLSVLQDLFDDYVASNGWDRDADGFSNTVALLRRSAGAEMMAFEELSDLVNELSINE